MRSFATTGVMTLVLVHVTAALVFGSSVADLAVESWSSVVTENIARGTIDDIELNTVHYRDIRDARGDLDAFVASLAEASGVDDWAEEDKKAFLINGYNALAMSTLVDRPCVTRFGRFCWPVLSIRDVPGTWGADVWTAPKWTVEGEAKSLNEVEDRLRAMGDPRIHACIVCASVSCPDLRNEVFAFGDEARLSVQMTEQVGGWLANTGKGMKIDRDAKTVTLSKIFMWFADDFIGSLTNPADGATVLDWILSDPGFVTNEEDRQWLTDNLTTLRGTEQYFEYNWRANDALRSE